MFFSPFRFLIGIVSLIILQHVFFSIVTGNSPKIKQPLDIKFDSRWTYNLHQLITQAPRIIGSDYYNNTVSTLFRSLAELSSSRNNSIQMQFTLNSGNFTANSVHSITHFQGQIRNIIVTLNVTNNTKKPLIFSAHIDSHSNTVGSYDDAINVALMCGIIRAILTSNYQINQPIIFAFLGSEEMGLHGSQLFMKENPNLKGNVLNLESLGAKRPFGLIWKAHKSSSVVKSFSKTNGALISTFFSDISRINLLKSRTDLEIYEKYGLTGGMAVFFGNPTLYHTMLDHEASFDDIEYAGQILTQFAINFNSDENEKDVIAFGFSPLVVIINRSIYNTLVYSVCLLALTTVMFLRCPVSSFVWPLGIIFGVSFWHFFFGSLIGFVNPLSYASDIPFWFYVLVFSNVFVFLIFECYDVQPNTKSFQAIQLIIEAILLFFGRDYDISIILFISIIPHIIFSFLPNKIPYLANLVLTLISLIPLCFMNSFLYPIVVGYMDQVPGSLANLLPIFINLFYSIFVCLSFVPISLTSHFNFGIKNNTVVQVILVFISAFIFMGTCLKPIPYSLSYPLLVTQSEFIYENLSATISMIPVNGERGINGIQKGFTYTSHISVINNFERIDFAKGPAFVQFLRKVKLPKWVNEWPQFNFVDVTTPDDVSHNERIIVFNFLGNFSCNDFESLVLVPHCPTSECIKSVNGYENVTYRQNNDGDDLALLRFAPVYSGFSVKIVLNTQNKINFDVLFTSSKITHERYNFRRFFKSFIQHYAKSYYVADTVFASSRLV